MADLNAFSIMRHAEPYATCRPKQNFLSYSATTGRLADMSMIQPTIPTDTPQKYSPSIPIEVALQKRNSNGQWNDCSALNESSSFGTAIGKEMNLLRQFNDLCEHRPHCGQC